MQRRLFTSALADQNQIVKILSFIIHMFIYIPGWGGRYAFASISNSASDVETCLNIRLSPLSLPPNPFQVRLLDLRPTRLNLHPSFSTIIECRVLHFFPCYSLQFLFSRLAIFFCESYSGLPQESTYICEEKEREHC